jgi:type III restriction enzyme
VFNDEAHHAYRRGEVTSDDQSLDDDKDLAKKNEREATIWIGGFYIQASDSEVGKPFPRIVSDFGLLDAIESGLVKIPQLLPRKVTRPTKPRISIPGDMQAKAQGEGTAPS